MRILTICLRVAAMLVGVALIVSQVQLNLEYLGSPDPTSGIGLAAIAVPVAMAVAVVIMDHCLRERRYAYAGVTFLVILCGVGHTTIIALERSAYARDSIAAAKLGKNAAYQLAEKAHREARARVTQLEGLEADRCRVTGSDRCKAFRTEMEGARQWALDRHIDLIQAGVPVEEQSMVKRYGTFANSIDIVAPILLPLAMEGGGILLIGWSLRRRRQDPKSPVAPTVTVLSKEDEAVEKIKALRDERRGQLPSVREISRLTGVPTTTAWRARSRVVRAA